ncbi:DUF507 family protein [bacterium]|nr:DUF507 family protein [candidate division CSSED10-310 bacterium]
MKLSPIKINKISHEIVNGMETDDNFDFIATENDVRLRIKAIIMEELRLDDDIDEGVRDAIDSMSRRIPEGSKEWELLYGRMYNEEMNKRRKF